MRPISLLAVSIAAALVLSACADAASAPSSEEVAASSPTESASPSASPSPAAEASQPVSLDDEYGRGGGSGGGDTGGASGGTATVMIMGFDFPDDITVPAGTTVTFINHDGGAHTVTEGIDGVAAPDAAFDEEVAAGASVEIVFDEPGTYQVTCLIHPTMNMVVTVEA